MKTKNKVPDKITERNPLIVLHISPKKNRSSILKEGLLLDRDSSGYGKAPELNAVYFFHENNINVIYETLELFTDFDIFEIKLTDETNLVADEDSGASDWRGSISAFGTLASTASIPKENINFLCNVNGKKKAFNW